MSPTANTPAGAASPVISAAVAEFQRYRSLADRAVAQLSDEQLRAALHPETNSVAVIRQHIAGNLLSRWTDFLTTDGEKPGRRRDDEFVDRGAPREELDEHWERGWRQLFQALSELTDADLARTVLIRAEPHTVALAIQRGLAHVAYHVGQIVMIARQLVGDAWQVLTIPRGASEQFNRQFVSRPSDSSETS